MSKVVTLTPALLRRIVLEEKQKLQTEAKGKFLNDKAEEVEADEYADTLEAHEEFGPKSESARKRYKALTIEERKLQNRLNAIQESKRNIRRKLARR